MVQIANNILLDWVVFDNDYHYQKMILLLGNLKEGISVCGIPPERCSNGHLNVFVA